MGLPVQMIVPFSLGDVSIYQLGKISNTDIVNCALAIAADATRSVVVYFILIVFKIGYSKAGASVFWLLK